MSDWKDAGWVDKKTGECADRFQELILARVEAKPVSRWREFWYQVKRFLGLV